MNDNRKPIYVPRWMIITLFIPLYVSVALLAAWVVTRATNIRHNNLVQRVEALEQRINK